MNLKKIDRMYKNKDVLNNKKELERKNEIMINRLMILFILAIAMITLLVMGMNVSVVQYIDLYENYALTSVIVTGVLFVLSVAFFVYNTMKKNSSDKTLNKYNILGLFSVLFLFALAILRQGILVLPILLAVTISVTLLIFIYYLYQKDFFWIAVLTAVGCFLIYYTQSTLLRGYFAMFIKIMLIALPFVLVWLTLELKKNKGYFGKNKNIKLVGENMKCFPIWILCGLFVSAGVLSFITLSFIFYTIIAVLAYFLAVGIYYTIKLI